MEIAERAPENGLEIGGQVARLDPGDVDHAHLGNADGAVAVDHRVVIDVDLAPGADLDLVARPDDVVGRDRNVVDRGEGARHGAEEIGAEHRQIAADRLHDELLELVALPLPGLKVFLQLLEFEFLDPQLEIGAGECGARTRREPGLAGSCRGARLRTGRRARAIADRVERAADILNARHRRNLLLRYGGSGSGRGLLLSGLDLRPGGRSEQDAEADCEKAKRCLHIRSVSKNTDRELTNCLQELPAGR